MANDDVAWPPLVAKPIEVAEIDPLRRPAVEVGMHGRSRIDDSIVGKLAE
ncbi:hypothetical protein [Paraburkholderia phenoliruptrix]|nr:hypothetical protein [Paraburkholderia phenoliruptrix]